MSLYLHLPVHFIEKPFQLQKHLPALLAASELGIDCESDSFHTYYEHLCFLQISTSEALYIIDCLSFKELSELRPVFSNPTVPKFIHGAEFDVVSLKRDYQLKIRGLFDTMIASQVLNCKNVGLGSQVENFFGVKLDKSLTTSPWSQRPISSAMSNYLINDIRYLIPLGRLLRYHLQRRGYEGIAEEQFEQMERKNWIKKEFNSGDFITLKGAKNLSKTQQKILFKLFIMREKLAQKSNQAVYRIFSASQLIEMAQKAPLTDKDIMKLSFRCTGQKVHHIFNAVQEGKNIPKYWDPPPKTPKNGENSIPQLSSSKKIVLDLLKKWRDRKSQEYNLLPWMISSNKTLSLIVKQSPRSLKQLSKIPNFRGYRLKHFGLELLEKLHSLEKQ